MSRIFRRGELRSALLHVLSDTGTANGYTIMRRLADHVGAGWRPSPGAIYPALLALEDAGHIIGRDEDGSRLYSLTDSGRLACDDRSGLLDDIARRASRRESRTTLGNVLDAFADEAADRSTPLDPTREQDIRAILATAERHIISVIDQGATND